LLSYITIDSGQTHMEPSLEFRFLEYLGHFKIFLVWQL
jgi:hypothetical protein